MTELFIYLFIFGLFIFFIEISIPFIIIGLFIFCCWKIYLKHYYNSEQFLQLKKKISNNVNESNNLNHYLNGMKKHYNFNKEELGSSVITDNSNFNYKRNKNKLLLNSKYIYNCSSTVCKNAHNQPFKYICKYFNIPLNEDSLIIFETLLNNYSSIEEGKMLLIAEKQSIFNNISKDIPNLIFNYDQKNLVTKLGYDFQGFNDYYFPTYKFQYVSPGGNSSFSTELEFNLENIEKFELYLKHNIEKKKTMKYQRSLMTQKLREQIKKRDNYICQTCGNSLSIEPNLLLEIDHIIPISKGGITEETNLQTLCWKCNRKKGAK